MTALSQRLRLAMEGPPKVSQAALARACKIQPPSVNNWLSGKSQEIKGANLLAVARTLNVSPEWLATGSGPMRSLNASSSDTEKNSRVGPQSQSVQLDEDMLHEAITLLEHDEANAGAYPPRAKTRRLADLYRWVAADGGRLSAASNREYERQVAERKAGGERERTNTRGAGRR